MTEIVSLFNKYLPQIQTQYESTNQPVELLIPIGNQHPRKGFLYSYLLASNDVPYTVPKTGGNEE